jgi:hypothetical protein
MPSNDQPARCVRFGVFEVDFVSGEPRKAGVKLKLAGQPFEVLAILRERPGGLSLAKSCRSASGRTLSSMSTTT